MDFDSISAAGQVLGLISTSHVQHSTWNNFQAPPTPYAHQRSSLLIKIIASLACYVPDLPEEENALFVDEFLECLQTEFSKLPGGAAERTAAASRNLNSLLARAESLTPAYLNAEDVCILRWFISQLEQPLAAQESDIHRVMEVHNSAQCPSPTPQSPSSHEHDEDISVNLAMVQFDQLACKENGQTQSSDVVGEDQMADLGASSGDQNIEPINSITNVEEFRSVQSEEKQQKKRKRTIMNDAQIDLIEKALLDKPNLMRRDGSLPLWAATLSLHGSEVTPSQLKNWLNNRRAKLARAAAKDARVHPGGDVALTEIQTGSGPDPISDSPDHSLNDEDSDQYPSVSQGTHRKDRRGSVLRICGTKNSQGTVAVSANRLKRKVGQHVILTDDHGEEVGKGTIHLARGVWFGKNLEQLRLCVVDVEDIQVPAGMQLPHPTDAGTTFSEAKSILCRMRILWDSSQLVLIQQQMP